jgi:iron(III) transport system permease protein
VTPGLAAAYFLGFISVAKELPVTLMLAMPGHQTLAYRIFDAQSEASLPDAGLAGLLLLGIAAGAQLAVLRLRRYAE